MKLADATTANRIAEAHQAIQPSNTGRRDLLRLLFARCLWDRRVCDLLERHRDGIVFKVPPLDQLNQVLTAGTSV